jgi:hypothetical protein
MSKPHKLVSESDEPPRSDGMIVRYLEPATILTLIVGSVYYIGWSYTDAYFERIGIQHDSLNFPTSFYLKQAFWALSIGIIFISAFKKNAGKQTKAETLIDNLYKNQFGVLLFAGALILGIIEYPDAHSYYIFGIAVISFIATLWLLIKKKSIGSYFRADTLVKRIPLVVLAFLTLVMVARILGEVHAKKKIEGTLNNVSTIVFTWKDAPPQELIDKQLVLIIHIDGNYYVTVREIPAPKFPKIYIIRDDEIKYAETNRIN